MPATYKPRTRGPVPEATIEEHREGNDLFREGNHQGALLKFTAALRRDPRNYKLFSNRALCHLVLGDNNAALADAERCAELRPRWPKAHYRVACALQALGRIPEARRAIKKGLSLHPDDWELAAKLKELGPGAVEKDTATNTAKKGKGKKGKKRARDEEDEEDREAVAAAEEDRNDEDEQALDALVEDDIARPRVGKSNPLGGEPLRDEKGARYSARLHAKGGEYVEMDITTVGTTGRCYYHFSRGFSKPAIVQQNEKSSKERGDDERHEKYQATLREKRRKLTGSHKFMTMERYSKIFVDNSFQTVSREEAVRRFLEDFQRLANEPWENRGVLKRVRGAYLMKEGVDPNEVISAPDAPKLPALPWVELEGGELTAAVSGQEPEPAPYKLDASEINQDEGLG
eukprot:TRINITY_DN9383_c0_g1_i1.p1 TRINITY_DN9383_c0_g1~~TRINITY_DN9383_c0_g1_i1.p1  ORF type:complete len:402 (-),score=90.04 TRINITY_DN9383_c0_g1_i1:1399-2604(-)